MREIESRRRTFFFKYMSSAGELISMARDFCGPACSFRHFLVRVTREWDGGKNAPFTKELGPNQRALKYWVQEVCDWTSS